MGIERFKRHTDNGWRASPILIRSKTKPHRVLFSGTLGNSCPPPPPICAEPSFGEPWGRPVRACIHKCAASTVGYWCDCVAKVEIAMSRIFAKTRNGSNRRLYSRNRVVEVACEFNEAMRSLHLYTKAVPAACRIFDHRCKTTFATQSVQEQTSPGHFRASLNDPLQHRQVAGTPPVAAC